MSWQRRGLIALAFLAGFASIAQFWKDPTHLMFDWLSITTGITGALAVNEKLTDASWTATVLSTLAAGLVGYGVAEIGIGWQYELHFDFRALYPAIGATGLIHINNQNAKDFINRTLNIAPQGGAGK